MIARGRRLAHRHDLGTLVGLAAGAFPLAAVVHLVAEFAATSPVHADAFVARHLYLIPLAAAGLAAFAASLGIGFDRRGFLRRAALTRAALRRVGPVIGVSTLCLSNVLFFAATQALEGEPIAGGSLLLGLAIAVTGSAIAAFVVFVLGRTLSVAIVAVLGTRAARPARLFAPARRSSASRSAARAFTLCLPTRPPPLPSI